VERPPGQYSVRCIVFPRYQRPKNTGCGSGKCNYETASVRCSRLQIFKYVAAARSIVTDVNCSRQRRPRLWGGYMSLKLGAAAHTTLNSTFQIRFQNSREFSKDGTVHNPGPHTPPLTSPDRRAFCDIFLVAARVTGPTCPAVLRFCAYGAVPLSRNSGCGLNDSGGSGSNFSRSEDL
jgi:hypothetical protein